MNAYSDSQRSVPHIRNLQELVHDPYFSKWKMSEPASCSECGAVYHAGHWIWGASSPDAHLTVCPACQRIKDHCPAGFLTLSGEFLHGHRENILQLLRNIERHEKAEHPLKRMMALENHPDGSIEATFTDPHLARAMGEAVRHAYKGELEYGYQAGEYLLRVKWSR
jgi:hypothetical protein